MSFLLADLIDELVKHFHKALVFGIIVRNIQG
jgi:hypothetical protein